MTKGFTKSACRNRRISQNFEGSFENDGFLGQVHVTKEHTATELLSCRNKTSIADQLSSSAGHALKTNVYPDFEESWKHSPLVLSQMKAV
jgi:hypothetical protein